MLGPAGQMPSFLIVSSESRYQSFDDFIKYAKANPGKVTYASSGVGSTGHLVGAVLAFTAGIDLMHVPFKSGPQGITAVVARDVDAIFYTSTAAMPLLQAGKVKALAVSTAERTQDMPDVPTISESGYPGFDFAGWLVLCAPAKTPQPIVDQLTRTFQEVSRQPAFQQKLLNLGIPLRDFKPGEFERFVKIDQQRLADLAATTKIEVD